MAISKSRKRKSQVPPSHYVYSSYYTRRSAEYRPQPDPPKQRRGQAAFWWAIITVAVLGFLTYKVYGYIVNHIKVASAPVSTSQKSGVCASNKLNKQIFVSVGQRHLWVCSGTAQVYDSAVVTGYQKDPADLTPLGSYKIYAKQTNTTLSGSDSTGSWSDPVYYWMPFLDNQYGTYGFHDATWRAPTDFGNISPNSPNASHGCVEMSLAAAKWLYSWAPVGTTVTIES